jgi:hypothetical protein
MSSGASSPTSTIFSTSTMQTLPAMAQAGVEVARRQAELQVAGLVRHVCLHQ